MIKEGKMPEKAVYSLTEAGEQAFEADVGNCVQTNPHLSGF